MSKPWITEQIQILIRDKTAFTDWLIYKTIIKSFSETWHHSQKLTEINLEKDILPKLRNSKTTWRCVTIQPSSSQACCHAAISKDHHVQMTYAQAEAPWYFQVLCGTCAHLISKRPYEVHTIKVSAFYALGYKFTSVG